MTWIKITQRARPYESRKRAAPYESRKHYESRIRWFLGFAHDRYPAPRSDAVSGKGAAPQFMVPASHLACHPFRICGLLVRRGCAYGLPNID